MRLLRQRHHGARLLLFGMMSLVMLYHYYAAHRGLVWNDRSTVDHSFHASPNGQINEDVVSSSSSAQTVLQTPLSKIPHSVNKLSEQLASSPNTVVTAYFSVKSKYGSDKYDEWMKNILSIQDAMVIFTQKDTVDKIKELRAHAMAKTVVIEMKLEDLPIAQVGDSDSFWENQLDIDREKKRHQSYQLFWIWLSKSWWTTQAIHLNYFSSEFYMWSDIGCFRNAKYNNKQVIQHPDVVPQGALLFMAHHPPNPPPQPIWMDKFKEKQHFYHSGSQAAGTATAWRSYHAQFSKTLDEFIAAGLFIGEDQCVLQAACLQQPALCAYVPFDQVNDNHYFGLRYVLHSGPKSSRRKDGNYEYWRPPSR